KATVAYDAAPGRAGSLPCQSFGKCSFEKDQLTEPMAYFSHARGSIGLRRPRRLLDRGAAGSRCLAVTAFRRFPVADRHRPAHAGIFHWTAGQAAGQTMCAEGAG